MQREVDELTGALTGGRLSRREFVLRASALGVSASTVTALLAACGGGNDEEPAEPAAPEDVSGNIILFKGPFSAEEEQQVADLLAGFEKEFPKVEVKHEQFAFEAMAEQFPTRFLSESPPDVSTVPDLVYGQWVERGTFEDLTPYVTDPSWKDEFESIPSEVWDIGKGKDGKIYGVPWWGVVLSMLFANLDLLREAGVTDYNSSFDAFADAARKVADLDGDAFGFSVRTDQYNPAAFDWAAWIHAGGGTLLNDDWTGCVANTPGAGEALQILRDLQTEPGVAPPPGAYDEDGLEGLFQAGRIALHHNSDGFVGALVQEPPGFEFEVGAIPAGPEGESPTGLWGVGLLTMSSKSEHKDAAWELIKYLSSADVVADYFQQVNLLPNRTDLADRMYSDNPHTQKVLREILPGVQGWQLHAQLNEMLQRAQPGFDALYRGRNTPEETLEEVCSAVENTV